MESKEARENTGILVIFFVGEVKIALWNLLLHRFLRVCQKNKDNQIKVVLH
jgi:hypothetical protein